MTTPVEKKTADRRPAALVTGGSRGIGRGIVLALARQGFNVIVNYARNAEAAEEVKEAAEDLGVMAVCVQGDIGNSDDRRRLADEAWNAFGGIDLLANNAGIAPSQRADILEASEASFDQLISTNLKGPYFLTQQIAKKMVEADTAPVKPGQAKARIVNVTSISATVPSINRGDYCISKAGLAMVTRLFAARLAEQGIYVYEIRPGIIETDMTGPVKAKYDKLIGEGLTPIRRWGRPEDVANAVVAIARGLFDFSTGEVINVDGGFHVRSL
jgi:NAD(P)-dependent dehydrogenase (short-subunit alcohol dehydrogenase family)